MGQLERGNVGGFIIYFNMRHTLILQLACCCAGAGERELATTKDFSKWGRVNYALTRRLELLAEVERLAVSIGVPAGAPARQNSAFSDLLGSRILSDVKVALLSERVHEELTTSVVVQVDQ